MTYDDDNRLATFNGQAVTHDADGNMTYGPLTNDTLVSYTYDARNRLISVGGTGSTPSVGYRYDPIGNRIALTNAGVATRFVINPNAMLSQVLMRVRPGVTNYYVYGLGLLYEVTETATNSYQRYYHYDYRGSTVALTDGNGNATDRIEYSAYGTTTYRTGTTDTPFLFNGRFGVQTDPNGLLYMRARHYNPYLCRFINPDPIGFSGGLNFYVYADGNPVSYLDPFGLCALGETGGGSWLGTAASIGVGFIALAGTLQSIVELISGQDYIAGEETSRFWAAVGVLAGIVPGGKGALKALTKVDDVVDVAKPVARAAADLTGQGHHLISRTVHEALEVHPNLKGVYQVRDPRFVVQAKVLPAHQGYQQWHRQLDAEVAKWVRDNPQATPEQFENFLRWRYTQPDLIERFPGGL